MPEDSVPKFMSNSGGSKVHLETLGSSWMELRNIHSWLNISRNPDKGGSGAIVEKIFL